MHSTALYMADRMIEAYSIAKWEKVIPLLLNMFQT